MFEPGLSSADKNYVEEYCHEDRTVGANQKTQVIHRSSLSPAARLSLPSFELRDRNLTRKLPDTGARA